MATNKNINVNVNVTTNLDEQTKKLGELTSGIKQGAQEIGKSTGVIGGLNQISGGLVGTLQGLVGGVKTLTSGFGLLGKAIIGTGIGLIVPIVALLIDYFKTFDPLVDKIEQGMASLGAAVRVVEQAFASLFDSTQDSGEAFANLGDNIAKAADEAAKLKEAQQDLADAQSIQEVQNARFSQQYDELILKSKNRTLSEKERIAFLEEAQKLEEENFEQNKKLADEEIVNARKNAAIKGQLNQEEQDNLKRLGTAYATYLLNKGKLEDADVEMLKKAQLKRIGIDKEATSLQEKNQNQRDKLAEKAEADRVKREEKAAADREKAAQKRAQDEATAFKLLNDQKLALMDEGLAKELEKNRINHEQRIKDIEALDTLSKEKRKELLDNELKLYEDQNQKVIGLEAEKQLKLEQLRVKEATKLLDDQRKLNDEILANQKALNQTLLDEETDANIKAAQLSDDKLLAEDLRFNNELVNIQKHADNLSKQNQDNFNKKKAQGFKNADEELAAISEFTTTEEKIEANKNKNIENATKAHGDTMEDITEQNNAKVLAKVSEGLQIAGGFVSAINDMAQAELAQHLSDVEASGQAELDSIEAAKQKELSNKNLTESQKKAIEDKYAKLKYDQELKNFKATEEIKKKQFEADKKAKIVGVIINTALGIAADLSKGFIAGLPFAALTAAMGALQIATISATKYEGGTPPSVPSSSSAPATSSGEQPIRPSATLVGERNDLNNVRSREAVNAPVEQVITVNAIVSETAVTETQNKVKTIQSQSEI